MLHKNRTLKNAMTITKKKGDKFTSRQANAATKPTKPRIIKTTLNKTNFFCFQSFKITIKKKN